MLMDYWCCRSLRKAYSADFSSLPANLASSLAPFLGYGTPLHCQDSTRLPGVLYGAPISVPETAAMEMASAIQPPSLPSITGAPPPKLVPDSLISFEETGSVSLLSLGKVWTMLARAENDA